MEGEDLEPVRRPWKLFEDECRSLVSLALARLNLEAEKIPLEKPPSRIYGELSTPVCMILSRKLKIEPYELASKVKSEVDKLKRNVVDRVEAARPGYLNFYIDKQRFFKLLISSVEKLGSDWGKLTVVKPLKILVEHTSVNPVHPIGIGHARNSFLGDSIASIFEAVGHRVSRHFYIDDVGRQVSILAYGYKALGEPKVEGKPDVFLGFLYAVTSCILEVRRLKSKLEEAKAKGVEEEYRRIASQLDGWVGIAADLRSRNRELFDKVLEAVERDPDPDVSITRINRLYEEGVDEATVRLVRKVVSLCIEGFKETLSRVGVEFDSWDWESRLVWSGEVEEILAKLKATPYVSMVGSALLFDVDLAASRLKLTDRLELTGRELPVLTLTRKDGTSLYTTRDIAYAVRKLLSSDLSVTVIGVDQKLPQTQLRVALSVLGFHDAFERYRLLFYGLVKLPGYRMSSRRGRLITLDQVLDEAKARALEEVSNRSPGLKRDEADRIAEAVAVGAVKYALISVSPEKDIVFSWDRVLDFERNSGPFLQYTYARASSILRKADINFLGLEFNPSVLEDPLEEELLIEIAHYPELVWRASEELAVHMLAEYANDLAMKFNSFYDRLPVLRAEPLSLKIARLKLVYAFRVTLGSALRLLGIEPLEKM